MTALRIDAETIKSVTDFHGHWCPGLAIGIRASEWVLSEMGKSPDENISALVETDMCGVDAIQYLTGCTFGKGNLVHTDLGKNAFTFYRPRDGKAVRLVLRLSVYGDSGPVMGKLHHKMAAQGLNAEEKKLWQETRATVSKRIMESELADIFEFKAPQYPAPRKARIFASLPCADCAEPVMETRTRRFNDQIMCIPCFAKAETA